MNNNTPRKSPATVTAEARKGRSAKRLNDAARRIAGFQGITPHALCAADSATRSLRAAEAHPLVTSVSDERAHGDGIWIYLADGWTCLNSDCGSVHEDTVAEAVAALKRARYVADNTDEAQAAAMRARAAAAAAAAAAEAAAAPKPEAAPVITAAEAKREAARKRCEAAEAAALAAWLPLRNARHAASGVNTPLCPAEAAALATLRAAQEAAVAARRRLA